LLDPFIVSGHFTICGDQLRLNFAQDYIVRAPFQRLVHLADSRLQTCQPRIFQLYLLLDLSPFQLQHSQ
jgi:hypothetical protein